MLEIRARRCKTDGRLIVPGRGTIMVASTRARRLPSNSTSAFAAAATVSASDALTGGSFPG